MRIGVIVLAGVVVLSAGLLALGGGDTAPEARPVLVAAERGTVTSVVSAAGTTVDADTRELAFGADGTVEKVYVKVGERVTEGQLLAKIDDTRARERYEEAKARLAAAEETLENIRNGTGGSGGSRGSGGAAAAGRSGGAAAAGRGTAAGGRGSSGTAARPTATSSPAADPSCPPSTGATPRDGRAGGTSGGLVARPAAYALTGYGTAPGRGAAGDASTATPRPTPTVTATRTETAPPEPRPAPTVTVTVTATPTVTVTQTVTVRPTVTVTATVTQTVTATPAPYPTATRPPAAEPTPAPTRPGGELITTPPASPPAGTTAPGTPSAAPSGTPSCGTPGDGQGDGQARGRGGDGQAQGRGQGRGGVGDPRVGGSGGAGGGRTGGSGQSAEAQAEAAVAQAKSELEAAKEALAGVVIRAPHKGTILSIAGAAGDPVTANSAFITLGNLDELQVKAMVTQSDVEKLKVGQKAEVILATRPGERHTGTVVHIDPTATTSGDLVQYGVLIAFDRRPKNLLLGQNATITVTTGESTDAVYVPAQAARLRGDGTAVVTVATGDGTAERTVRTGVRGDRYVEIVDGLREGDKVVLPSSAGSGEFPDGSFPGLDPSPSATPS